MTDADLERMLTLDSSPGPALAIGAADADAIVEAALIGAGFGPGPSGGSSSGAGGAGMATGTKLAIVGASALALIVAAVLLTRDRGGAEQVATVIPPDAAIDAAVGSGSPVDAAIDGEAFTIDERPTRAPTQPKPHRTEKPEKPEKATDKQPTVDDLLGEANAKRAAKEWRESDLLYGKVVDKVPKSLAAQTALVASGSLHLEHLRDPRGAAKRFRRALELAPSGAVAEDARWGLAEAMRALHDDKAEADALDDFLAHHASSPLASRAKSRRAELP